MMAASPVGTLFLVRHGRTAANRNTYVGWGDPPLDAAGAHQAAMLLEILRGERIDAIYSSPLQRALETARMHLTATNTGITAAIGRDGAVLAQLPQFSEGRLEVAARGYRGSTPYVRHGDWPAIGLAAAIAALLTALSALERRR